jgi:hypothetical protein
VYRAESSNLLVCVASYHRCAGKGKNKTKQNIVIIVVVVTWNTHNNKTKQQRKTTKKNNNKLFLPSLLKGRGCCCCSLGVADVAAIIPGTQQWFIGGSVMKYKQTS